MAGSHASFRLRIHFGVFDRAEIDVLIGFIGSVGGRVANYAGHYCKLVEAGGYQAFPTDDQCTRRIVGASGNGVRFACEQGLVVLDGRA